MNKSKKRNYVVLIWSFAFALLVSKIFAEYSAMKNTASAIKNCASHISTAWKDADKKIFAPHINLSEPFTVESDTALNNNDMHIKASYIPESRTLTASINSDEIPSKTYYAFFDGENAGLSVNGRNGLYYSVPANTFRNAIKSYRASASKDNMKLPDSKTMKYINGVFKTIESVKTVNFDKEKCTTALVGLFMNCRFDIPHKKYITTNEGRVRANTYSFKVKNQHINTCFKTVAGDITKQTDSDILQNLYDKISTSLEQTKDKYAYVNVTVYKKRITDASCTLYVLPEKAVNISFTPDYQGGSVDVRLTDNESTKEICNIKLTPSDDKITLIASANGGSVKCSFNSSFLKSVIKTSASYVSVNIDAEQNGVYDVELVSGKEAPSLLSFRIYNSDTAAPPRISHKPVSDIGFSDSISMIKVYGFVNSLKVQY